MGFSFGWINNVKKTPAPISQSKSLVVLPKLMDTNLVCLLQTLNMTPPCCVTVKPHISSKLM